MREEYTGSKCSACSELEYYQVVEVTTAGGERLEVSRRGPSCWLGWCERHQEFSKT